jgi:hypothetical protein
MIKTSLLKSNLIRGGIDSSIISEPVLTGNIYLFQNKNIFTFQDGTAFEFN